MAKRRRNSGEVSDEEPEVEDLKAVFIDTSLDTHLAILASPSLTFSLLKELITSEHSKCFPDFGEIKITAFKVKREETYYHLSESMILRLAFHGVDEDWFVFAEVASGPLNEPPKEQSVLAEKLQPSITSQKHLNSRKRQKTETHTVQALVSSCPVENTHKFENDNALKASLVETEGSNLNQERAVDNSVDNSEAVSESRVKKSNRKKKSNDDGVDRSQVAELGQEPDVMRNDVSALDNGKVTMEKDLDEINTEEEAIPVKPTSDAELLVERERVDSENTALLKSSELKARESVDTSNARGIPNEVSEVNNTVSASGSQARRTKKKSKKGSDDVNQGQAALLGQVLDSMQNSAAAVDSKAVGIGEGELDSKRTADEEIKKSEDTSKKKKRKTKASVATNQDMSTPTHNTEQELAVSRPEVDGSQVAELGQGPDVSALDDGKSALEKESDRIEKEEERISEKLTCEVELASKRTPDEEIKKSEDTSKNKKKRKTKNSVTENRDLSTPRDDNDQEMAVPRQEVAEFLQSGDSRKPEHSAADSMSKSRTMEENAASEIVTGDLREKGTNVAADQGQMHHEDLSDIPANPMSTEVAEGTKVDKPKARKKTTKKSKENAKASEVVPQVINESVEAAGTGETVPELLQLVDSNKTEQKSEPKSENPKPKKRSKSKQTTPAEDVPEIPVTEQADNGKPADDSLLTNSSVSGNKNQSKFGDVEHVQMNDISVGTIDAQETTIPNPEKPKASKTRQKKIDQPPVANMSSNLMTSEKGSESERTSLVVNHLQSDIPEAEQMRVNGVETLQPPQDNNPDVSDVILDDKPKKRRHKKQPASEKNNLSEIVPMNQQSDISVQKTVNVVQQGDDVFPENNVGNAEKLEEASLSEKCLEDSTEVRKLNNQPALKPKGKKLAVSSSVDTSSIEHNLTTPKKKRERKKIVGVGCELQNDVQETVSLSQNDTQSVKLKQTVQKNPTLSANVLSKMDRDNGAAEHENGMPRPENSLDGGQLQKSVTEKERDLKPRSSPNHSRSSKRMDAQVPAGDQNNTATKTDVPGQNMGGSKSSETSSLVSGNSAKRTRLGKTTKEVQKKNNQEHGFKTPLKNIAEVPVNASPQKKQPPTISGGLFGDISTDSSDGKVERSGSSSSTRTPDDISSSDYSEGESKGYVVSSQYETKGGASARHKRNTNLSAFQGMSLEDVLRRSSRYKQAKLVASQSQMEDEIPEFVPDSLAD